MAPQYLAQREVSRKVTLACRPVLTERDLCFYFGENLLQRNILPVVVHLENNGNGSITVGPKTFRLLCEDGETLNPVPWSVPAAAASLSWARSCPGFLAGIVPGFLILHSIWEANAAIEKAYRSMALRTSHLPPGGRLTGVVFFKGKETSPEELRAKVHAADLACRVISTTAGRTEQFTMYFHLWEDNQ